MRSMRSMRGGFIFRYRDRDREGLICPAVQVGKTPLGQGDSGKEPGCRNDWLSGRALALSSLSRILDPGRHLNGENMTMSP
jgi:hypothetical protein